MKTSFYGLVNAKGEIYFEEVCLWGTEGDALQSGDLETLQQNEPDDGWHVAPLVVGEVNHDMVTRALEAAQGAMIDTRRHWTDGDRDAVQAMLKAALSPLAKHEEKP